MKKVQILAVIALLMMFACSEDSLIDTEQDSIVVEENNQTIVNGEPGNLKEDARFGAIISFSSRSFYDINSTDNDNFFKWEQTAENPYPTVDLSRKLMRQGTFSGKLIGFGKINSSISTYTFNYWELVPIDSPPNYGERLMCSVKADGKIYLMSRDNCSISVVGNVYPWYYTQETNPWITSNYDGGLFIGTATIHSGVGKLKSLNNKKFEVYSLSNSSAPGINLETGTISLSFSNFEYSNQ